VTGGGGELSRTGCAGLRLRGRKLSQSKREKRSAHFGESHSRRCVSGCRMKENESAGGGYPLGRERYCCQGCSRTHFAAPASCRRNRLLSRGQKLTKAKPVRRTTLRPPPRKAHAAENTRVSRPKMPQINAGKVRSHTLAPVCSQLTFPPSR
jgi:hypothetical protein